MIDDKYLYSKSELSKIFGMTAGTVAAMIGGITPVVKKGNRGLYNIADVVKLTDTRVKNEGWENQWGKHDPNDEIETDPNKMKPADRRLYWQSVDLEQAAMLKQRKNAVEARDLIPAREVEIGLSGAFKTVALTLDTLPDALERDGVIGSAQIGRVIDIMDSAREHLANDLLESSMQPVGEMLKMLAGDK